MSAALPPPPPQRHALGLPAGSVRALLALCALGLLWLLVLFPMPGQGEGVKRVGLVYCYLQILMLLILAHFFTAHGHTIRPHPAARSPLGLPRGSVRFLLIAGYVGLAFYLWRTQPRFEYPPTGDIMLLVALLLTAYFVGHLLTVFVRFASGGRLPFWFQDIQAWIAILAMLVMGGLIIVELIIKPSLADTQQKDWPALDPILAALVGFYFGARS
jgi:hypothetical protein